MQQAARFPFDKIDRGRGGIKFFASEKDFRICQAIFMFYSINVILEYRFLPHFLVVVFFLTLVLNTQVAVCRSQSTTYSRETHRSSV